jgi:hypothetical protein
MRKIIETVEEYDANGKLTRKTVTETTEEGAAEKLYEPYPWWINPFHPNAPTVTYTSTSADAKT